MQSPPPSPDVDLERALNERFQLPSFRPWQKDAIEALLYGPGRVLLIAPTGGGKSLTYQLPAALLPGTTLVVSPLVALMEDQVRSLTARGIHATYLASTLEPDVRRHREALLARGAYKLVYAAPERLASESFVSLLARSQITLVAVDEAHCIAQWGHDFRPDYLRIGGILERLAPPRVLACTATATPAVRREIRAALGFREGASTEVLRGFARPNLHLAARYIDGPREARAALFSALDEALGSPKSPRGGAIVYAATRRTTEQFAELLREKSYRVGAYHAGLDASSRTTVSSAFSERKLDVVVATNAFGMGIDRPDIRLVVHVQPPSSIEAYYQEVGRAGRDEATAHGLLLCSGADIALRRRLVETDRDGMNASTEQAARAWSLFRELLLYLDAGTCRHDFVLRYFGDEHELLGGCGHCDVCATIDARHLAGAPSPDSTDSSQAERTSLIVRKALSAVARADRRAGLVAIAEMLHGDRTTRAERFGFTELSTFGLLSEHNPDFIVALLRAMLAAGWIDLTPTDHPVPFLTGPGRDVMHGRIAARIALPPEAPSRRTHRRDGATDRSRSSGARASRPPSSQEQAELMDDEQRPLFERLRAHRSEVAKERGVPAYVIAPNRTLVELAQQRPRTMGALSGIHGFGPARIAEYGEGFLAVLTGE
ncbi:RecQ family ATP-dependent DNA helicase [Pendulispora albinea]|uniref:ATP-dependent DNA helicase RecQ n=1 Tax=Pendulispora albinea TaxID=2741071 RepID=A0ABZ2LQ38_9BACT